MAMLSKITLIAISFCACAYDVSAFSSTSTRPFASARRLRDRTVSGVSAGHATVRHLSSKDAAPSVTETTTTTTTKPSVARDRLRKVTGFSWTAVRATWGAATGISFTAVYASAVAVSGAWLRKTMTAFLSIFPAWARYFVQPFLIAYYAPLFMIRNLVGPTRQRALAKRRRLIEGWQDAVDEANDKAESWPIESSSVGYFQTKSETVDVSDALAESVEMRMDDNGNGSEN